jgi:hypothetical protein
VLSFFKEHNLIPDWIDFIEQSIKYSWRLDSTLERISSSCFEVYGKQERDEIIQRLKYWIAKQFSPLDIY